MNRGLFFVAKQMLCSLFIAFLWPLRAYAAQKAGFLESNIELLWIIFYCLLGLLVLLAAWEITVQVQLRKYGDDLLEGAGTGIVSGGAVEKTEEPLEKKISEDEGDSFRALLNKASDDVAEPPARSGYKACGVPGLDPEHIRRGEVPKSDVPMFDGSSTLPVWSQSAAGAPPVSVPQPSAEADDSNPFRRLAKIGAEERPDNSASIPGPQTIIAPVARPAGRSPLAEPPAGGNDPWKSLLSKSAPAPAAPVAGPSAQSTKPSMGMPSGASRLPGSAPGRSPASAPAAGGDDPWKALLGGINNNAAPKPPAGSGAAVPPPAPSFGGRPTRAAVSLPIGANEASSGWPKSQPSRPRGISLDIKRGGARQPDAISPSDDK